MRTGETRERAASARGAQAALAAALAVAGGTSAYGTVVRFDNPAGPGHFEWSAHTGPAHNGSWLDVRLPVAGQQRDNRTWSSFRQYGSESSGYTAIGTYSNETYGGQLGELDPVYGTYHLLTPLAEGVLIGTTPPAGTSWGRGYGAIDSVYYGGTALSDGVTTYIGVRFRSDASDPFNYGWIGVVRNGWDLDVFAWGYETEPGVPIAAGAVPAPGSLALLAFGAVASAARPRRKCC